MRHLASRQTRGVSLVSYGLVVGLISVVALAAVTGVGSETEELFTEVDQNLDFAVTAHAGASGAQAGDAASPAPSAAPSQPPGCSGADLFGADWCAWGTAGSFTFTPPSGVTEVDYFIMGGGGGGQTGHTSGGGSGFISRQADRPVSGTISLSVGAGGSGGARSSSNTRTATNGGQTCFDGTCANGGHADDGGTPSRGGSGGGGGCNGGNPGGNGGSNGANGQSCTATGGQGQGSSIWTGAFGAFSRANPSAGSGGDGGTMSHSGGGGGGGVLIDGSGPFAADGEQSTSGKGGEGYGAGGGAGGYDGSTNPNRWAGGDGADGLLIIQW
ncbi:MAG: hypothetical protein Alpg2KO_12710 [Alphaproteobacteria bacterium]